MLEAQYNVGQRVVGAHGKRNNPSTRSVWFVKRRLAATSQALWNLPSKREDYEGELGILIDLLCRKKWAVRKAVQHLIGRGDSSAVFTMFPERVYESGEEAKRREVKLLSLGYMVYRFRDDVLNILVEAPSVLDMTDVSEPDFWTQRGPELAQWSQAIERSLLTAYRNARMMEVKIQDRRPRFDREMSSETYEEVTRMYCEDLDRLARQFPYWSLAMPISRYSPAMWRSFSARVGDRYLFLPRGHGFTDEELQAAHQQIGDDPDTLSDLLSEHIVSRDAGRARTLGSALMVVDVRKPSEQRPRSPRFLSFEGDEVLSPPSSQ